MAKHAKRPGLHTLPEAASLLATPDAAKSGTDTLQTLQNWAPAPLLQACAPLCHFILKCEGVEATSLAMCQPLSYVSCSLLSFSMILLAHSALPEYDIVSDQALVMMGGPAGRVPAVREYALRSLQACNPDQVRPPASVLIMHHLLTL